MGRLRDFPKTTLKSRSPAEAVPVASRPGGVKAAAVPYSFPFLRQSQSAEYH